MASVVSLLIFSLLLASTSAGCVPCFGDCSAVISTASPGSCVVNCSQPNYANVSDPCYQCSADLNCLSYGGSCDTDPAVPCACNYGFTNDNCSATVTFYGDSGFDFLVYFLGLACMVSLCVYAIVLLVFLLLHVESFEAKKLFVLQNVPVLTTILCFMACFLRIFYFFPDPYAFTGARRGCASWTVDYFSTYFVSMAFCAVTWQWVAIVSGTSQTKSKRFRFAAVFFHGLKVFLIVQSVLLLLCATAASGMSCFCDGIACPYDAPDYLYFIAWQVLNGITIICCLVNAVLVISGLKLFHVRHQRRIRFFTVFVILVSVGMIFLMGYTISLFVSYAQDASSFLVAESLEQAFIVVVIVSILVLLTVTRRGASNKMSPPTSNFSGGTVSSGNLSGHLSGNLSGKIAVPSTATGTSSPSLNHRAADEAELDKEEQPGSVGGPSVKLAKDTRVAVITL